jgi:hypothetical protein
MIWIARDKPETIAYIENLKSLKWPVYEELKEWLAFVNGNLTADDDWEKVGGEDELKKEYAFRPEAQDNEFLHDRQEPLQDWEDLDQ